MKELEETITERRRKTRNGIYRCLYESKSPQTQMELAQNLSLSLPTVHQNLMELLDAGLLHYAGAQKSTGGRRARSLAVNEKARFAVGISITENRLRFLAADLRMGELAYKKTAKIPVNESGEISVLVAGELERFLDENNLDRSLLLGVGIAVPAVVDHAHKTIVLSPTLRLKSSALESLEKALPYPCFVENDGTCGGCAETFDRPEAGSVAYLSLENGVGGAVTLGGVPYVGNNRRSGEFGHMCVEAGGRICRCGRKGCLEAYCSARRLSGEQGISLEEFFASVNAGDNANSAVWNDFLDHLAVGIHNIRMALDCEVILGGFLIPWLEPSLPALRARVAALNPFGDGADYIQLSAYPRRAVVRGAALHYIKNFIENI